MKKITDSLAIIFIFGIIFLFIYSVIDHAIEEKRAEKLSLAKKELTTLEAVKYELYQKLIPDSLKTKVEAASHGLTFAENESEGYWELRRQIREANDFLLNNFKSLKYIESQIDEKKKEISDLES